MKALIQILLFFCIIGFASCTNTGTKDKTVNKTKQEVEQIKQDSTYYADSIYYANLELDSVVYDLKGGNKLYLYPTDGNRLYNYRLVGENIDTIFLEYEVWGNSKYQPYFDGIDFDDYFILTQYADIYLFEKKTGKPFLDLVRLGNFDIKRNLLTYLSVEDEGLMLLNLKTLKKVDIYDYIKETETSPYMQSSYAYCHYQIHKVTNKYVIIWFVLGKNEEDGALIEIKIPINKIM